MNALLNSEINNDFMEGLLDGKLTYDKEKTKHLSKKKSRLEELEDLSLDKERDKGQDLSL